MAHRTVGHEIASDDWHTLLRGSLALRGSGLAGFILVHGSGISATECRSRLLPCV